VQAEAAVLCIRGLSFINDISWWAEGADDREVAARITVVAAVSIKWAAGNGWLLTTARLRQPSSRRRRNEEEGTHGDGGSWH